jgi:hypothetical protein
MTKSNVAKVSLVLLGLLAVVGVLLWGPFSSEPDPGPDVHLPSMENIPPSGTHLRIEIDPSVNPTH